MKKNDSNGNITDFMLNQKRDKKSANTKTKRILLVEDEPSALRHLKMIIVTECVGFEVVGEAENGLEAIEKIKELKPDIVITDIKMPIMDGIELVFHIKNYFPTVYSIIISGYQDFEYAKDAIKSGVVEYLLKPINIIQLKNLLRTIFNKLEIEYNKIQVNLLKKLIHSSEISKWELEKYFSYEFYRVAIIREKSLPSRFMSPNFEISDTESYTKTKFNDCKYDYWRFTNRDEKEYIYVYGTNIKKCNLENILLEEMKLYKNVYTTCILDRKFYKFSEIGKTVLNLYYVLSEKLVIGFTQILYINGYERKISNKKDIIDDSLTGKLNFLISNGMYGELKNEIIRLFAEWESDKRTQLYVENILYQIFNIIIKYSKTNLENLNLDIEIDEAMYYSNSYGELMSNIWELITRILESTPRKNTKIDAPEFIELIEIYLNNNLLEQLSLKSVCNVFGISQTYLSRLFRKYKKMSYSEYLTTIRIEKAKQLIDENKNIPLKDIANFVGYSDQFYFSKVFRIVTGMPPSEYLKKNK